MTREKGDDICDLVREKERARKNLIPDEGRESKSGPTNSEKKKPHRWCVGKERGGLTSFRGHQERSLK